MNTHYYGFEKSIQGLLTRIKKLELNVKALIYKLETGKKNLKWTYYLDNFSRIIQALHNVHSALKFSSWISLEEFVIFPLMISDQFDEALFTLTDRRMPAFTKDVMLNSLSTEPDSFVKEKFSQNKQKVSNDSVLNRIEFNNKITAVLDAIAAHREKSKRYKRKSKKKRVQKQQRIGDDTLELVTFVTTGKSLNCETTPVTSVDNAVNAATVAVPDTITVDTITKPVLKPRIKIRELCKNQKFK